MTERESAPQGVTGNSGRIRLAGLEFDPLSEAQVIGRIIDESGNGRGGYVVTPNIDICRQVRRDVKAKDLVRGATLVVPDGMPLVWAARLAGRPFPERVTGSSLIFTLSRAAARAGRSVYFLGGPPGVADLAAANLARDNPGLRVAGTDAPPAGFDESDAGLAAVRDRLVPLAPDIVFVGLGFPRQERLMAWLSAALPGAWLVGCGAAIPFAAGTLPRAPRWMQRCGLEWAFRLLAEPRRLYRRYLVHDLPYAGALLTTCAIRGLAPARPR